MSHGMPVSQTQAAPVLAVSTPGPLGFLRATWDWWKKIARAVGVVQTRLLMVVFYFLVVLPLGLIMRMSGDPLHLKPGAGSNWSPHRHEKASLDTARRQF
jgi:hypothetical protein